MNIKIPQGLKGAQNAQGTAVIIDVFRASSTILACLHKNVKKIIPVETVEEAWSLKHEHRSWILVGERNAKKIFGFDYGNSPATIITLDLLDETIILTTSSGTKGLIHACDAEERIIASFSNISNVISYLKEKQPTVVSLIPMGLNAESPAI